MSTRDVAVTGPGDLSIQVVREEDGPIVVLLAGELDLTTAVA